MNLTRALRHMERGRYVRRKSWGIEARIYIAQVDQSIRWANSDPTEDVVCSLTAEDIKAQDWEAIK